MTPFTCLTGIAAALPRANIDTDQIIPGRFLKTVTRSGLGAGLFDSLRHDEHGALRPDFVLNRPAWRGTRILIAGENFGCGSSREHAPWALLDYGIRCVIAPSFGDIFYGNSVNCGLLPAIVSPETVTALVEIAETAPTNLTVDLPAATIAASVGDWRFQIGEAPRDRLLSGLDQIGVTLAQMDAIRRYEQSRRA